MKWCHNSKSVKEMISPQFYSQSLWKQICVVKCEQPRSLWTMEVYLSSIEYYFRKPHLAQVRNVIFVKTNILCNFQEVWDPVHSCDELPVYVQPLLAVFLIHVKILFCQKTKDAQRISYTSISLSTPLVHQ